jgi:hypothetical protein
MAGTTGSGLDQFVEFIFSDNGLAGATDGRDIVRGAAAANSLNQLILEAASITGAGADARFSVEEVVAMNQYVRDNRLKEWTDLHGDDEDDGTEFGYHLVQNDGANGQYRGKNLLDTVADGVYHLGFAIQDGNFLNEDGNANATVQQMAEWLTQFFTDHSRTNTGLDRITNFVMADAGLDCKLPDEEIAAGADAADGLNHLIANALTHTGVAGDNEITVEDVVALNGYIRADKVRQAQWTELHGDDEKGSETGFHLVQNDGASGKMFGQNFVNTVADGIYHLGFEIRNGRLLNEDGDDNATLTDVADWLSYFYLDQSTTGTGLDRIVDVIKTDAGLAKCTKAGDIVKGAAYADEFNHLIANLIQMSGANADGWITAEDLRVMNAAIRGDAALLKHWNDLHGDDEEGEETGFHLVVNDGASTQFFGKNLVNTVADGIYHLGYEIQGDRFLNEDGNANQTLADIASWLNFFYNRAALVNGDGGANAIEGSERGDQINAGGGDDSVKAGEGDDLIFGSWGRDAIEGGAGDDLVYGGSGNDALSGGDGDDSFRVTGNKTAGFEGYDTYDGGAGKDAVVAYGGQVDIGLAAFGAANGIEIIDASGASGPVRLLGDWNANTLDFSAATLLGGIAIDGGGGNDTIVGSAGNDVIEGGGWGNQTIDGGAGNDAIHADKGNDTVSGGDGDDSFRVTGNKTAGFEGYDTYDGGAGKDAVVAYGGQVDIGLAAFGAANGIEIIDASGASGPVRLLGDWNANTLDFSAATLLGGIAIDGGGGNDTIVGSAGADDLRGGEYGNDVLNGGAGTDLMQGGKGKDVFVFDKGWGRDTVSDYADNSDKLDFRKSGAAGFGDLKLAQVGQDIVISLGADEVVLLGINAATITQSDFIFA